MVWCCLRDKNNETERIIVNTNHSLFVDMRTDLRSLTHEELVFMGESLVKVP